MSHHGCAPKRKLLVILGAGSSVSCGMPTVSDISTRMKEWSRAWTEQPIFPKGAAGEGVFNDLWSFCETYYKRSPRPELRLQLNFEKILGEMSALAAWVTPSPFGTALRSALRDGEPSGAFTWPKGYPDSDAPFFYRQLVLQQLGDLLDNLARYMRDRCKALNPATEAFLRYHELVARLREEFDVGIYNLNYDTLATRAWPEAFTGFSDGKFDPRAVALRREWGFVYHLHGSVHYSLAGPFKREYVWRSDLRSEFIDCGMALPHAGSDFRPILPTTLVAGGFKLDQLLSDPAQSFYAALIRHVHEADAVLIAGYGFGDMHVNRALQNRYNLTPTDADARPPAILIERTLPELGPTGYRSDLWTWEMTQALNTSFPQSETHRGGVPYISDLVTRQVLEADDYRRIAIWHGGFTEALDCIDVVINWLHQ